MIRLVITVSGRDAEKAAEEIGQALEDMRDSEFVFDWSIEVQLPYGASGPVDAVLPEVTEPAREAGEPGA